MARKISARALLVLIVLAAPYVAAQNDDAALRASFNSAYQRYQSAISAGDLDAAAEAAEASLRLGRQVFGDANRNTANLTQNHAYMLELRGFARDARAEYRKALDILEELYGPRSIENVSVLISLAGLNRAGFGEPDAEYLLEALSIQKEAAPDDLLAYSDLAVEAGKLMTRADPTREGAIEILSPLLEELEREFGRESAELVPVLMVLGKAEADPFKDTRQSARYRRAIRIAEDVLSEQPLQVASLKLEAGRDLLYMARTDSGEHYLRSAYETFDELLGADHELTATAQMSLGELRYVQEKFSAAEDLLLTSLEFFASKPQFQSSEQRIRTLLVDGYEREGESDKATEHVLELGRLVRFSENQALVPLFRVEAEYPARDLEAGRQGRVIVGFTVDRNGRPKDLFIVSSDVTESMQQAAMDAVSRYRYAPRVVDGSPVDVPNVSTSITFNIVY
jgi:TonB family protein